MKKGHIIKTNRKLKISKQSTWDDGALDSRTMTEEDFKDLLNLMYTLTDQLAIVLKALVSTGQMEYMMQHAIKFAKHRR